MCGVLMKLDLEELDGLRIKIMQKKRNDMFLKKVLP